jgi:hypothetical protein
LSVSSVLLCSTGFWIDDKMWLVLCCSMVGCQSLEFCILGLLTLVFVVCASLLHRSASPQIAEPGLFTRKREALNSADNMWQPVLRHQY